MIKLVVGLGNPGPEYEATRHNAGFWWVEALARELKVQLVPERSYWGLAARATVQGQPVWLLEPQTFMNLSGKSAAALSRFFKIAPEEILVVHDELDLQPGQAKLKFGGSHAGHNGLRDIHAQLGTAWPTSSPPRPVRRRWSSASSLKTALPTRSRPGLHCWRPIWTRQRSRFTPPSRPGPNRRGR